MKNLGLFVETLSNVSDDKILEAASFALRMKAIEDLTICVGVILILLFAIYSFSKTVSNS